MPKKNILISSMIIIVFLSSVRIGIANNQDADKLFSNQKYVEAINEYNKLILKQPKNTKAYFNRGISYFYTEQYDLAVVDFDKVIELDPKFADGYNFRGLAYSYIGDIDKSVSDFNKAIKLDPKFAEAYLNRSSLFVYKKEFDKALLDLNTAAKLQGSNPEIFLLRGNIYFEKEEYIKAEKDFSKVLKLGLENEDIWVKLAISFYNLKRYDDAVKMIDKAIVSNPKNLNILNNKIAFLEKLGRISEIDILKKKILELHQSTYPVIKEDSYILIRDSKNYFDMKLPKNWYVTELNGSLLVSDKTPQEGSRYQNIYAKIDFKPFLADSVNEKDDIQLIMWWEEAMRQSGSNYAHYFYTTKKEKPYKGGYPFKYNKMEVQFVENGEPFLFYDIAIGYQKGLFHAQFQFKKSDENYFNEIIDYISTTININFTNNIKE